MNGKIHRMDGPAHYNRDSMKRGVGWYQNGKCHRRDGPAVYYRYTIEWWYYGDRETREANRTRELNRIMSGIMRMREWLPIESHGGQFPFESMIFNYIYF
jgi:hypothetical protein